MSTVAVIFCWVVVITLLAGAVLAREGGWREGGRIKWGQGGGGGREVLSVRVGAGLVIEVRETAV